MRAAWQPLLQAFSDSYIYIVCAVGSDISLSGTLSLTLAYFSL